MRNSFFFGFLCLALGAMGVWYYFPYYQQIHSNAGQLALLVNPQLQTKYSEIERFLYASIIGVIVGLVLMAYGAGGNTKVPVEKTVVTEGYEGDMTERMAKLKDLYDKNLITEEEYNKRKSELLSKI